MRMYLPLFGLAIWATIMFTGGMVTLRSLERDRARQREAETAHPPTSAPESR